MLFQCAFKRIELEICFLVLGTCIEVGTTVPVYLTSKNATTGIYYLILLLLWIMVSEKIILPTLGLESRVSNLPGKRANIYTNY